MCAQVADSVDRKNGCNARVLVNQSALRSAVTLRSQLIYGFQLSVLWSTKPSFSVLISRK
jgi:hypothetical protein